MGYLIGGGQAGEDDPGLGHLLEGNRPGAERHHWCFRAFWKVRFQTRVGKRRCQVAAMG
jgi:hypothetical protein